MPGLLNALLPYVYSQSDRLKRHVGGLLSDPRGTLEQTAGGLLDAHRGQQNLLAQAFADPGQPFKMTDPNAMQAAAMNMLAGPLGVAPMGITAWHGSPHVFDKFDSSKIGSGEGAQVYGHGLYLAEAPEVAKEYAKANMGRAKASEGFLDSLPPGAQVDAYNLLQSKVRGDVGAKRLEAIRPHVSPEQFARLKSAYEGESASLYKVDLPDDKIAKMLDYDNPVPEPVRQRVSQAAMKRFGSGSTGTSGERLYTEVVNEFKRAGSKNPAVDATEFLRQQGIPGIRYLDGNSRGAAKGSSNFVVFPGEENALRILERSGVPTR